MLSTKLATLEEYFAKWTATGVTFEPAAMEVMRLVVAELVNDARLLEAAEAPPVQELPPGVIDFKAVKSRREIDAYLAGRPGGGAA
jgi:hypothetical protein